MKSLASAEVVSETRERLLALTADDRALWGRMTTMQMVRHLGQAYEIALGDRTVAQVKGIPPVVMRWMGLWSGMRWPKNVPTTPELAQAMQEDTGAAFDELIWEALEKMESLAAGDRCAPSHPMFGPMRVADWLRWGYLHADHHLRQFGR